MNYCKPTLPEETCCFTGHRSINSDDLIELPAKLFDIISRLYEAGVRSFRCGGALGFDTLAALSVIRCKQTMPEIRLVLVLPCCDQAEKWNTHDKNVYKRILSIADEVVYTAVSYSRENMIERDRALVDGCGMCIAYLNHKSGGTAYTADYALHSGLQVVNLGSLPIEIRLGSPRKINGKGAGK